jgi:tetratricopeptide (TPR) repeat protein
VRRAPFFALFILGVIAASAASVPTTAFAGSEDEAARQLDLAEQDLENGLFERAAASAASALRLDPGTHGAFVVRGLALKGLGRLDDAAALLRAYRDLRGTLPLDDRVEPALEEIERLLRAPETPRGDPGVASSGTTGVEPLTAVSGPVILIHGPANDSTDAERAYAVARPWLRDAAPAAVFPLTSLLAADGLIVLGADSTGCPGTPTGDHTPLGTPALTLDGYLAAADDAALALEPEEVQAAAAAAELVLACGTDPVNRDDLVRLLAARALGHWAAGTPEIAGRRWSEMYSLDRDLAIDTSQGPSVQAMQLAAKANAQAKPDLGELRLALPEGWSAEVDGQPVTGPSTKVPVGRRIVRISGPGDVSFGAIVTVARNRTAVVGTGAGITDAFYATTSPPPEVMRWVGRALDPEMTLHGADAALVVDLDARPPRMRRYMQGSWLLLTPSVQGRGHARARGTAPSGAPAQGRVGSAVLLGGGLVATAVGLIVAAVAVGDGRGLEDQMGTGAGWDTHIMVYRTAQARERIGVGIAIGGGVVAAVGGITIVIPTVRGTGARSGQ